LSFDYAGDVAGRFTASGAGERGSGKSFAVVYYTSRPVVDLAAFQPRASDGGDLLFITFERPTGPGTYEIRNDDLCPAGAGRCASGTFQPAIGAAAGTVSLVFTEGTLHVTAVTETEVSGTFSGVAREEPSGLQPHPQPYLRTTITNGRFRAPFTEFRFSTGPARRMLAGGPRDSGSATAR
ncbi:MAG TPA: hypothetical protein VFH27_08645, partial [Longimicrobiaceae bacterium]|nr:hypothetical protein [Longimicrobiaceae bacterium]